MTSQPSWLLYGANGYTGELVARLAVESGLRPTLAGRNPDAVARLAGELGLAHRVFDLDGAPSVDAGVAGMALVLHCAGPFVRTARPMANACLRRRVHYLDITGEVVVFEALAARDAEARAAGVMLLPGAGFDVVPSDCLAAHLKARLPAATHLALAFRCSGRPSRGTASTVVENLPNGGLVRRDGRLVRVPPAWRTRRIDFGTGPLAAMTIPWGDLSTAWHSTRVPNIEVYMAAPAALRVASRLGRPFARLLGLPSVQRLLLARVRSGPPGPSPEARARGRCTLWGEARAEAGRAAARLRTPDGYTLTAHASLALVRRVLAGQAPPGFQTPSLAYGADFVLELPGVEREDLQ